jgi:tetratricopeptide (TPR) repeat protein
MGQDKAGATGTAVSLLELVLVNHGFSPQEEARKRRWRAQKLRALDEQAEHFRETNREHFPPDERLTLHEALKELDRGIGVDQYDAEMWNLKSAWCRKLERREEALEAAGHAIKIRPYGYAKPHINKAQVLWELGRDSEALACAQEALRQAREAGDAADEQHAQELVEFCRRPRVALDLSNFRFTFERVMRGSNILADIETGEHQAKPEVVTVGFFNRCRKLQGSSSNSYVPIMAELLSDFTPERAFQVVSAIPGMAKQFPMIPNIARVSQEAYDHCLHAALYITAYSEDVRQRDAARFLCMVFFGALEPEKVRMAYRQAILETSAAAVDEMSRLDEIMRAELGRINPNLPRLIADQESVNEEGRKRALRAILSRFTDHGSKPKR